MLTSKFHFIPYTKRVHCNKQDFPEQMWTEVNFRPLSTEQLAMILGHEPLHLQVVNFIYFLKSLIKAPSLVQASKHALNC